MKRIAVHAVGVLFASLLIPQAVFADKPPGDAKPLSEIILILESQGYGPVVDVEFDDGLWEVEAYRDNTRREVKVDPRSGDIVSNRRTD